MISSPLWHATFMGKRLDLSQLVEVGDPFFNERWYLSSEQYLPVVGFTYSYRDSEKPLTFVRGLKQGPDRLPDLSLKDPGAILDQVREETYTISTKPMSYRRDGDIIIYQEDGKTPVALKHIKQEHESLIKAWEAWKEIEPEIYAIIRKHLT
jgi:hypothetical protein